MHRDASLQRGGVTTVSIEKNVGMHQDASAITVLLLNFSKKAYIFSCYEEAKLWFLSEKIACFFGVKEFFYKFAPKLFTKLTYNMKKSLLLSLAGAAVIGLSAYAVVPRESGVATLAGGANDATPASAEASSEVAEAPLKIDLGHAKGAAPTNMTQLCKEYVLSFTGARVGWTYEQGNGVKISRIGTTDTVLISGGWYFNWVALKAIPNFTAKTLTILPQYCGDANATQQCWFIKRDGTSFKWPADPLKPTVDEGVVFTLNDDGTIGNAPTGWALAVGTLNADGTIKTSTSGWAWTGNNMTTLYPANGTMTYTNGTYTDSISGNTGYTVPVYATQNGNVLTVRNFWNKGIPFSFILNSNGTMESPRGQTLSYSQINTSTTTTAVYTPYTMEAVGNAVFKPNSNGGSNVSWSWGLKPTSCTAKSATFGPFTAVGYDAKDAFHFAGLCVGGTFNLNFNIDYTNQPFTGAGTAASPYLIPDLKALQAFISMASVFPCDGIYFKQTANIDLGGAEMTLNQVEMFQGSYDGGGFTISGLNLTTDETLGTSTSSYYQGLFKTIGTNGIIKNLTLAGSAKLTRQYCGVLCGTLFGTLENVTSNVSVNNTASYCGGMVGLVDAGAKLNGCVYGGDYTVDYTYVGGVAGFSRHASFTNCGFTGKFIPGGSVRNYVGGICAVANPSDFIGCYSKGEFPNDSTGKYRGGIVAYANVSATATVYYGTYNFKNCVNESNILGAGYLGGIIGDANVSVANTASNYMYRSYTNVDSCVNKGNIHVTATSSYVGGIMGRYNHSSKITNCSNYGKITSYRATYVGGIIGGNTANPVDSTRTYISNCVNYGNFKSAEGETSNYYIGGVIGNPSAWTTIENCTNYGDMDLAYEFGGVVGYAAGSAGDTIRGCVNYGNLTAYSSQVGGVLGYCTAQNVVVDQCANFGDIMTNSTLQGLTTSSSAGYSGFAIGGVVGKARGIITNCLNAGTVTGASQVGGIVGATFKGTTSAIGTKIYNNLNTGKVVGRYKDESGEIVLSLDTVGGIVGSNFSVITANFDPSLNKGGNNYYTPNVLADYGQIDAAYLAMHPEAKEIADAELVNNTAILNGSLSVPEITYLENGWSCYDKYCWPAPIAVMNSDMVKLWAAQVVAKHDDVLPNITGNIFLGKPAGVHWASSVAGLNIKGNEGVWSEAAYNGPLTLTATCGNYTKKMVLNVAKTTGIESLNGDGREVVSEMWISTNGVKVARPMLKDGKVYMVVRKYSDGTAETIKVLN